MVKMNGTDLLTTFRQTGSEEAFRELLVRFTNLVYSVAKRRLDNAALAEDVTQTVFIRLARVLPRLSHDAELVGWLHRTTLHVAIDVWRSETRRRAREEHAATMQPTHAEPETMREDIAPRLDEALNELNTADRQTLLLRFYANKSMREVGSSLGISEDAAKMRVSRAVDRLRSRLAARGVTCTAVALTGFLAERAVEAAPGHLVTSLTATQYAAATMTGGVFIGAFTRLASLISKVKLATAVATALVVGIAVVAIHGSKPATPGTDGRGRASERAHIGTATGEGSSNRAPEAREPRARKRATTALDAAMLEDARSELRALLIRPRNSKDYPPTELQEGALQMNPEEGV